MAEIRKLGRTADHRVAMLKNLSTSLIWHGQIETTEQKAKEVKSIVDSLIALAIKEKDNFETVEETVKIAKVDPKTGAKVTEEATSKAKKDKPSRLAARRKIMANINKVKDENGNNVDLPGKLFGEIADKYADRKGGYTRIIKLGKRKGDAAEVVILQLV